MKRNGEKQRAALYIRVSKEEQAERYGPKYQLHDLRKWADQLGYEVVEPPIEEPGYRIATSVSPPTAGCSIGRWKPTGSRSGRWTIRARTVPKASSWTASRTSWRSWRSARRRSEQDPASYRRPGKERGCLASRRRSASRTGTVS